MKLLYTFGVLIFTFFISNGYACTGFFIQGVTDPIVAKTLDWSFDHGLIYINKRNIEKKSGLIGNQKGMVWTSKYMSLTLTQDGRDFPWEGMNEKGLVITSFALDETILPSASDSLAAIEPTQWIQYLLDTSATLNEAIVNAKKIRPSDPVRESEDYWNPGHYFVCDINSECAVFEYLLGQLVIHRSNKTLPYFALTNDIYEKSVEYFKTHATNNLSKLSTSSLDRFVRAVSWSQHFFNYNQPYDNQSEINYAFSGLSNVSQNTTHWRMVFNLSKKTMYLITTKAPIKKMINLQHFNPSCLEPVKILNVNSYFPEELSADDFKDYSDHDNQNLINKSSLLSVKLKKLLGEYPKTMTRCLEEK